MDEILWGYQFFRPVYGLQGTTATAYSAVSLRIIATHDLALAELINTYPQHIANYHFDVQVAGKELYFDYKLKTGICQSLNASLLMKKIGSEI